MSEELKPCPFCGGEAQLMINELEDTQEGTVMCMTCYVTSTTQKSDNWKEAIEAWNTRAQETLDVEVLKVAQNIQNILDGKDPMNKWKRHTGVKTIDDLMWLVKSKLRECLILQGAKHVEGRDIEDMTDWALGKQSAYGDIHANLQTVTENLRTKPDNTEALPKWADFERIEHESGEISYEAHGDEDTGVGYMGNTFIRIDGLRAKTIAETIRKALGGE